VKNGYLKFLSLIDFSCRSKRIISTLLQKIKSPTFAFVIKRKAIFIQRLIAGLFLALFLFIHVVKISHHHHQAQSISKEISKGLQASSSYSDCSICDYQVAKDSYHFNDFPSLQKTSKHFSSYSFYHSPFLTSIGSTSSGRGPPSFS